MKTIQMADAQRWQRGEQRNAISGVYGLVDPRDGRVRYVGSSQDIAHRLYSHRHSSRSNRRRPCEVWLVELKNAGVQPFAIVLEECEVGAVGDPARNLKISVWVDAYDLLGEADLNVRLTPIGHVNSLDSSGKLLNAEVRALRKADELFAKNSGKLFAEWQRAKQHALQLEENYLQHATRHATLQRCIAGEASRCNTAGAPPLGGPAVLHDAIDVAVAAAQFEEKRMRKIACEKTRIGTP